MKSSLLFVLIGCRYVARLEHTLVQTCAAVGVSAKTTDETGVWVDDRKIGSIGTTSSYDYYYY